MSRPVSSGGCESSLSIRDSPHVDACELDGYRAHLLVGTLPIGVRIVHRDGLDVSAVPSGHDTCRYACHVLGFEFRDQQSGAWTRSIDAPLPIGVRGMESCDCIMRKTCWVRGPVRGSDSLTFRYLSVREALTRVRASQEGCAGLEVRCADPTR